MLLRFDIGRKLDGTDESRFGFLRRGVTDAILKIEGKTPWLKERFASVAMISEKTELHDFSNDVAIKSQEMILEL
jgi:hypothetical protein